MQNSLATVCPFINCQLHLVKTVVNAQTNAKTRKALGTVPYNFFVEKYQGGKDFSELNIWPWKGIRIMQPYSETREAKVFGHDFDPLTEWTGQNTAHCSTCSSAPGSLERNNNLKDPQRSLETTGVWYRVSHSGVIVSSICGASLSRAAQHVDSNMEAETWDIMSLFERCVLIIIFNKGNIVSPDLKLRSPFRNSFLVLNDYVPRVCIFKREQVMKTSGGSGD